VIFHVPQFIDIEDKIVGPLTWKQLGWLTIMGVIIMVMWKFLEFPFFVAGTIPIALIFLALAFYKPYGLPLVQMINFTILYLFSAKLYTWHRAPRIRRRKSFSQKKKSTSSNVTEVITLEELQDLAATLDNPGSRQEAKTQKM